jgi:hypothetical protein
MKFRKNIIWNVACKIFMKVEIWKKKKDQNGRPTKFFLGGGGGGGIQILWWPSRGARPYLLSCSEIMSFLWWVWLLNSCSVPNIIALTIFILRLSCFEVLLIQKWVIFPNCRSVSPMIKLPYFQSLFKLVGCDFFIGLQFALFLLFGFCNRS